MDLIDLLNINFKIQKDKTKPGNTQKSDFDKSQNSAKWSVEDEAQQSNLRKTFKNLKNVPLHQFSPQDYLFLRRELEFDNIKTNLY